MKLKINGEPTELAGATTVADVVEQLGYQEKPIAVALNGDFVARARYAEINVKEGDALELVAPIAGG